MATVDIGSADSSSRPKFNDYVVALYDDPIRHETAKRGRWLVGISLAVILTIQLHAKLVPNALVYVSLPAESAAIPASLTFIVLLLLVEFALRALTDLYRGREFGLLVARYLAVEKLQRERIAAKAVDDDIESSVHNEDQGPMEPDPWWERYFEIDEQERKRLEELDSGLGERTVPQRIRMVRVWFEICVPLVLGLLALFAFTLNLASQS